MGTEIPGESSIAAYNGQSGDIWCWYVNLYLMKRREYLAGTGIAISALAGCSSGGSGGESLSLEEVKEQAESVSYEDLMRNEEEYLEEYMHYSRAKISQVFGDEESGFELIIKLLPGQYSWDGPVAGYWNGERFLEDDIVEFWAQYTGLEDWERAMGQTETIPAFDVREIVLTD